MALQVLGKSRQVWGNFHPFLYLLSECCWVTALLRLKEDFGDKGG